MKVEETDGEEREVAENSREGDAEIAECQDAKLRVGQGRKQKSVIEAFALSQSQRVLPPDNTFEGAGVTTRAAVKWEGVTMAE